MSDTPTSSTLPDSTPASADASAEQAAPSSSAAPAAPEAGLNAAACAAELKARFPALFAGAPKPLKLRIQADIQERAPGVFTKAALSAFFRRYTGSTSYLIAISRGRVRFDLDGQPAGELSAEHREAAEQELARRRAITQERRAMEEGQRQERLRLLRDFERTTLTLANFCALKGLTEEALQATLAQAREEAAAAPRPERPPHPRHDQRADRPARRPEGQGRPAGRGPKGPARPPRA